MERDSYDSGNYDCRRFPKRVFGAETRKSYLVKPRKESDKRIYGFKKEGKKERKKRMICL